MTEEIIIDGVDVAECKNYKHTYSVLKIEEYHDCVEKALIHPCNANPNCYFKQLQRLKAENEELKKYEYTYLDMYINLKQALEEIKIIAGNRFVSGLNEEADCYNNDMEMILTKINEVLNEQIYNS